MIDAYARRIVGWSVSTSMTTDFVLHAFEQAVWTRNRYGTADFTNLVHHNDRGSQDTSIRFGQALADAEIAGSVGTTGDSYDTQSIMCPGWQIVSLTRAMTGGRVNGSDPSYDWRPRPANALICRPIGLPPAPAIVSHMS